jgi:hypothetical protein
MVSWSAAADEVNDFVRVAGLDGSSLPLRARKDVAIALDRDAIRGNAQMAEQFRDIQAIGNFARFAIDSYRQDFASGELDLGLARST